MGVTHGVDTRAGVDIHANITLLGIEHGPSAVAANLPRTNFQDGGFRNGIATLVKLGEDCVVRVIRPFAQMAGVYLLSGGYWVSHHESLVGDRLGNAKGEENEVTALFITTGSATDKTFHMIFAPGMLHRMINPISTRHRV